MVASLLLWIGARDWRHGVAVAGLASTWLPWFLFDDRPIFFFYAIACLPFMVLSVALAMGHLVGTSDEPTPRRTFGVVVAGSYTVLALIAFAWFWPVWTDVLLTKSEWDTRIWFQRWI
jgi:dolichyl-phosphate-mannose--protein O-mannosyl transferase